MFVPFLAALAAAIVVIAFVQTWGEYGSLPERVPMSIGFNGTVNAYGPRSAIWLLPVVMLVSAGIFLFSGYALAMHVPGAHGSVAGLAVFAPCILAILWRAQALLISGAKSGGGRVAMGGFWIASGFLTLIALSAIFTLG